MKKALAMLIVLVLLTGAVFADPFGNEAAVAVEGDATLTWGFDLDSETHGFKNEANWKITIPLLTKQTFGTRSEGDAYAEINIVDAQYNIVGEDGDNDGFEGGDKKIDSVNAKLHFGNVYMTVYDKPGFKTNYAEIWAPIKNDGYFDDDKEGKVSFRFEPGFDGAGGTKLGYKTDMFDIGVKLASQFSWGGVDATDPVYGWVDDDDDPSTVPVWGIVTPAGAAVPADHDNYYAFGVDLSATPNDMIAVAATFNYASWEGSNGDNGVISVGFEAKSTPVEKLDLKLAMDAGDDYVNFEGDDTFAFDLLFSAKYDFVEAGAYYYTPEAIPFAAGFNSDFEPANDMAVYLKVTDGGKVENLSAWATVMAYRVLSAWGDLPVDMATPLAIGTGASYKVATNDVNYVKPFFELYAQNMSALGDELTDFVTAANLGVDYGLFTNAVVTAKYEVGATQDNLAMALIKTASKDTKGLFTLAVKVTY